MTSCQTSRAAPLRRWCSPGVARADVTSRHGGGPCGRTAIWDPSDGQMEFGNLSTPSPICHAQNPRAPSVGSCGSGSALGIKQRWGLAATNGSRHSARAWKTRHAPELGRARSPPRSLGRTRTRNPRPMPRRRPRLRLRIRARGRRTACCTTGSPTLRRSTMLASRRSTKHARARCPQVTRHRRSRTRPSGTCHPPRPRTARRVRCGCAYAAALSYSNRVCRSRRSRRAPH